MAALENAASSWLMFFRNAGIPQPTAGNYAILFSNHRIQMDMLSDLSRDILQAMGITVMGDIIGILKHAKEIHAQNTREKTLGSENVIISPAVVRISPQQPLPIPSKPTQKKQIAPSASIRTGQRRVIPSLPKFEQTVATETGGMKRKVVSLKSKPKEEVPVKKNRRVLPEHEGSYTVKMPAGLTERTRRLLSIQGGNNEKSPAVRVRKAEEVKTVKRSVFERLGEGNQNLVLNNDVTKITVTNFGRTVSSPLQKQLQVPRVSSSVFDRLGPDVQNTETTGNVPTVSDNTPQSTRTVKLNTSKPTRQYQGVSKTNDPPKVRKLNSASSTVTSSNAGSGKLSTILSRLGPRKTVAQESQSDAARAGNLRSLYSSSSQKESSKSAMKTEGIFGKTIAKSEGNSYSTERAVGTEQKKLNTVQSRLGTKVDTEDGDDYAIRSTTPKPVKRTSKLDKNTLQAKLAKGHKIEVVTRSDGNGGFKKVKILKKITNKNVFKRLGGNVI